MKMPLAARLMSGLTRLLLVGGLLVLPGWALAQSVAKPNAKSGGQLQTSSRAALKSKASQMAAGVRAADQALSPAELAIAQRIEVGRVACELGAFVQLTADAQAPGYFDVQSQKLRFRMAPVATSTGAIRLEDAHSGAVWLQLANKSMLMDQKNGRRLADACMTPSQQAISDAMLANPPPSLLEPLPSVRPLAEPLVSDQTVVSPVLSVY